MRRFVLESFDSTEETGSIDVEPFRLSTETAGKPSHFEIVFVAGGVRYRYGFEATQERVTAEWLYTVPRRSEALLFERNENAMQFGRGFKEGRERKQFTRPNALFLTVLAQTNAPTAQKVLGWFRKLGVAFGISDFSMLVYTTTRLLRGRNADDILRLVTAADTGIEGLNVVQHKEDEPSELHAPLTTFFDFTDNVRVEVNALHTVYNAEGNAVGQVEFELEEQESQGTRKLFALAAPLLDALREGEVIVIDEFDARFHPLLSRQVLQLFNDPATNPNHAQLVIVTHDTYLMSNQLLRRDQIWFVEKDGRGASTLYSLAEFKGVRNDKDYERGYLEGRYGAVPNVFSLAEAITHYEVDNATTK